MDLCKVPFARSSWSYTSTTTPLSQRLRVLSRLERIEEARAFLQLFHQEAARSSSAFRKRWGEVERELKRRGTYSHTEEELAFGARVAWRNNGRCIGRILWNTLEVFDCRHLVEPEQIMARVSCHMREAVQGNCGRPIISIFQPAEEHKLPCYIESFQITQYAGYVIPDGTIIGDRQNIEATRIAESLGGERPGNISHFDVLPILMRDKMDRRVRFVLPPDCVREVAISHPNYSKLATLGLRWYAVPCVSGLILTIGGIEYPCAPFSGFYVTTEIASRDLTDKKRYDLLPVVAEALGFTTGNRKDSLWRDAALTELNAAVLHSFKKAGIAIIDHHTASNQFMEFHSREQSHGRRVAGDWRWIVPPQASAACDVFHLKMTNFYPVPNYYHSRADDGLRLMPFYGDLHRNRWSTRYDKVKRRWKIWKRSAW